MVTNEEVMKKLEQISNKLDALEKILNETVSGNETVSIPVQKRLKPSISSDVKDSFTTDVKDTYTPEEVNEYFGKAMDEFNSKKRTETGEVDYLVSNIDVDLKTHIAKDGELKMSAPDMETAGKEAVSTVKISIKAVPKRLK
ncbi:MAG: hypothetical protein RBQ94_04940 [Methanimicrococcus sp.]|nr:hypothetical protein [Methanimicrococcus sp.]